MNERDILTEKKYAEEKGFAKGREEGREEGLVQGHANGLQEGLAKGREEENRRIALNMKKAGIAVSVIEQVTGLSFTQIDSL